MFGKKVSTFLKDKKVAVSSALVVAGASFANAAVTFDSTTGALQGNIEMTGYNSALTIIIPAIVTIAVGTIILRTIKRI